MDERIRAFDEVFDEEWNEELLEEEAKQVVKEAVKELMGCIVSWMFLPFLWMLLMDVPGLYFESLELYVPGQKVLWALLFFIILWLAVTAFQHSFRPLFWRIMLSLIPVELICLAFFMQYHLVMGAALLVIFVVFQAAMVLWIRANMKEERRSWRGRRQCRALTRRTAVLGLNLLLAIPTVLVLTVYGVDQPMTRAEIAASTSGERSLEVLVEENRAELEKFGDEAWKSLAVEEKMDLLQTLVNMEASFLCLDPVEVVGKKLEGRRLGEYRSSDNTIHIDTVHLESAAARDVIETVSHECRHAYQQSVVKMLDWEDETVQSHYFYRSAQRWKAEFEDYIAGDEEENFVAYYNQQTERDARSFGEQMLEALVHYMEWET